MSAPGLMAEQFVLLHAAASTFLFTPNSWPLTLEPNLMFFLSSDILFPLASLYPLVPDAHLSQEKEFFRCSSLYVCWCFLFYQPALPQSSNNKHRKPLSPGTTDKAWEKKSTKAALRSTSRKQALASARRDAEHLLSVMGCRYNSLVMSHTMWWMALKWQACQIWKYPHVTSYGGGVEGFNIKAGASICTKLQRRETAKRELMQLGRFSVQSFGSARTCRNCSINANV